MRPGVTSMMRARPWEEPGMTPAWEPVKDRADKPNDWIAIASSAIEMRSPAVRSMSSSRPGGSGDTCCASSSSSSVVSPMAETTTQTSCPAFFVSTIRSATRLMRSASDTEEPPYFCTTSPIRPRLPAQRLTRRHAQDKELALLDKRRVGDLGVVLVVEEVLAGAQER